MLTGIAQEPDSNQFYTSSQGEVLPTESAATEVDDVAFKLWRHAHCFNLMADECECCKGAAQECFVTCR